MANKDLTDLHSLAELATRFDPDGMLSDISEQLLNTNEIIPDIPFRVANDKTSHLYTKRTSLPAISKRRFNEGVAPTKSTTGQYREPVMMTEAYSEVDVKLAKISGNPEGYRYSEDVAFAQAFANAIPEYYFNGTGVDDEITGLKTRFNSLSNASVYNVGGSTADVQTSLWLIQWGEDCFGIYPEGSMAGFDSEDLGKETKEDSSGKLLQVYRSRFSWDFGLVIRDEERVARLCNVEVDDYITSTPAIDDYLIDAINHMPNRGAGAVLYGNKDAMAVFDLLAKDKTNVNYTWSDAFGRPTVMFRGSVPIRLCEAISSTEAVVS